LIDLLVEQRLLSTDVSKETDEVTIEPAHEALLRQWGLLREWLAEDSGLLGTLEGIKRASREWEKRGKNPAWLTHRDESLKAAEDLSKRKDLAANLGRSDQDYLVACRKAQNEEKWRPIKTAVAAVCGLLAVSVGVYLVADNVYQQCYRFDPRTSKQSETLGPRICQPGRLVYFKYTYPYEPQDRPNRVIQVAGITPDTKKTKWIEQDLSEVKNDNETWGSQDFYYVQVIEDIGIGGGMTGYVLRRIDLQSIPLGGGETQCSKTNQRTIYELAVPVDLVRRISDGLHPTVRYRKLIARCDTEIRDSSLPGPDFEDTKWPIAAAVADPTFGEWIAEHLWQESSTGSFSH
jgi:hypothetical protein